jgi:hypothetical protein
MEYKEVKTETKKTSKTYKLSDCVKCGGNDLKIDEYEDTFGYITTISCKKCKNETRENSSVVFTIKSWNEENDLDLLIKSKTKSIEKLKSAIIMLKILKKKRKK